MKRLRNCFFVLLAVCVHVSSFGQQKEKILHHLNDLLVHTVMEDLYTPPVASRIYVYPNIAFYECIRLSDRNYQTLAGKLNGLNKLPLPNEGVDYFIAASYCFSLVAKTLVASEYRFDAWIKNFTDSLERIQIGSSNIVQTSFNYGKQVADSIIAWTQRDNYLRSRGMMRFVASEKEGTWQPTPNDYAPGLEPNWTSVRPLTLTSSSQFSPKEKLVYSRSNKSKFFKNVMDVYTIGKKLDSTKKTIASYWDDNPNVSVVEGHLTYFVHKISPGGHWLMITKQACIEKNIPVERASLAYTLTATAIFDGFISCWDEKYKTNLVRPITFINTYVDQDWKPFIQTPPFPEFTSGHSVISNAAATVLTALLGDNYHFTDETEIPFGQKPRTFNSFFQAAEESSMSRVYGGIHYPETARISIIQGRQIGRHVLQKLNVLAK